MSIYDRTQWPKPEENPLILMIHRDDEWFSNEEVVAALGLSEGRALLSNQTAFVQALTDDDTGIVGRDWLTPTRNVSRAHGGAMRVFNRRAVVLVAMRTNTINAAAFRDWMADQIEDRAVSGYPI